jgi:hypothetical protein
MSLRPMAEITMKQQRTGNRERWECIRPIVFLQAQLYVTVHEKRGNFAQNVKSCYEPVKFTCHIGNVLAAVVSIMNIFGTK